VSVVQNDHRSISEWEGLNRCAQVGIGWFRLTRTERRQELAQALPPPVAAVALIHRNRRQPRTYGVNVSELRQPGTADQISVLNDVLGIIADERSTNGHEIAAQFGESKVVCLASLAEGLWGYACTFSGIHGR
jgi:hypothetical protein